MRKTILFFVVCLLASVVAHGQAYDAKTTALILELQKKLDEWHKAGSFPGATLGVALANGKSFGIAVGGFRSRYRNLDEVERWDAGRKCR